MQGATRVTHQNSGENKRTEQRSFMMNFYLKRYTGAHRCWRWRPWRKTKVQFWVKWFRTFLCNHIFNGIRTAYLLGQKGIPCQQLDNILSASYICHCGWCPKNREFQVSQRNFFVKRSNNSFHECFWLASTLEMLWVVDRHESRWRSSFPPGTFYWVRLQDFLGPDAPEQRTARDWLFSEKRCVVYNRLE